MQNRRVFTIEEQQSIFLMQSEGRTLHYMKQALKSSEPAIDNFLRENGLKAGTYNRKGRRVAPTQEDADLLRDYLSQGVATNTIARAMRRNPTTLHYWAELLGLKLSPKNCKFRPTGYQTEKIKEQFSQNWTMQQIADHHKISKTTLNNFVLRVLQLKRPNNAFRPRREATPEQLSTLAALAAEGRSRYYISKAMDVSWDLLERWSADAGIKLVKYSRPKFSPTPEQVEQIKQHLKSGGTSETLATLFEVSGTCMRDWLKGSGIEWRRQCGRKKERTVYTAKQPRVKKEKPVKEPKPKKFQSSRDPNDRVVVSIADRFRVQGKLEGHNYMPISYR